MEKEKTSLQNLIEETSKFYKPTLSPDVLKDIKKAEEKYKKVEKPFREEIKKKFYPHLPFDIKYGIKELGKWYEFEKTAKEEAEKARKKLLKEEFKPTFLTPFPKPEEAKKLAPMLPTRISEAELFAKPIVVGAEIANYLIPFGEGALAETGTKILLEKAATNPRFGSLVIKAFTKAEPPFKKFFKISPQDLITNTIGWGTFTGTTEFYANLQQGQDIETALQKGAHAALFGGAIGGVAPIVGSYLGKGLELTTRPIRKGAKLTLKSIYESFPEKTKKWIDFKIDKIFPPYSKDLKFDFIEDQSLAGLSQLITRDELRDNLANPAVREDIEKTFNKYSKEIATKGGVSEEELLKASPEEKYFHLRIYAPEEARRISPKSFSIFDLHESKYKDFSEKLRLSFQKEVNENTKKQLVKVVNRFNREIGIEIQKAKIAKDVSKQKAYINTLKQLKTLSNEIRKIKDITDPSEIRGILENIKSIAKNIDVKGIKVNVEPHINRIEKILERQEAKLDMFKNPSEGYITFATNPLGALKPKVKTPAQRIREMFLRGKVDVADEIAKFNAKTLDWRSRIFNFENFKRELVKKEFPIEIFEKDFKNAKMDKIYEILKAHNFKFPVGTYSSVPLIRQIAEILEKEGYKHSDAISIGLDVIRRFYSSAKEFEKGVVEDIENEFIKGLRTLETNPGEIVYNPLFNLGIFEINPKTLEIEVNYDALKDLINAFAEDFTDFRYLKDFSYAIDFLINPYGFWSIAKGDTALRVNFLAKYAWLFGSPFHARSLLFSKGYMSGNIWATIPDLLKIWNITSDKALKDWADLTLSYYKTAFELAKKYDIKLPVTLSFPKDYYTAEEVLKVLLPEETAKKGAKYVYEYRIFEYLYPYLKAREAYSILKDLEAGLITKEQAINMLKDVNTMFGGLPELLYLHPNVTWLARMLILAPDWQLSLLKQTIGPFTKEAERWTKFWTNMITWNFLITINMDRHFHPDKPMSQCIEDFFNKMDWMQKNPFTNLIPIGLTLNVYDWMGFEAEQPTLLYETYNLVKDVLKGADLHEKLKENLLQIYYNRSAPLAKFFMSLGEELTGTRKIEKTIEKELPPSLRKIYEYIPLPLTISTFIENYAQSHGDLKTALFNTFFRSTALARTKIIDIRQYPYQLMLNNVIPDKKIETFYKQTIENEAIKTKKSFNQVIKSYKDGIIESLFWKIPDKALILKEAAEIYHENPKLVDNYLINRLTPYVYNEYEKKYNIFVERCKSAGTPTLLKGLPAPNEIIKGLVTRFKRAITTEEKPAIREEAIEEAKELLEELQQERTEEPETFEEILPFIGSEYEGE